MNKGMLRALMLFSGIAVLLLVPGCREDCKSYDILLTQQQKNQIPFEGRERIYFTNGQNEIALSGTGRHDTIEKVYSSVYSCDYTNEETDFLTFEGEDINLNLRMRGRDIFNISLDDFSQDFHMLATLHTDQSTGELSEYDELIDSLIIKNSLYLNVYKDTVGVSYPINGDDSDSVILATYIYYSTDFGVVKIDFSDSTSWELDHIEW
jgi:hypothetical protein